MNKKDILNKIKMKLDSMSSEEFYNYLVESEVEVYKSNNIDMIFNKIVDNVLIDTEYISFSQEECEFFIDTKDKSFIMEAVA